MNLIDAIKSGMPFRRSCWDKEILLEVRDNLFHYVPDGGHRFICADDISANDWELSELGAKVTRAQFWDAVSVVMKREGRSFYGKRDLTKPDMLTLLARELGLEPK